MKKSNQKTRRKLARAIININRDVRRSLLGTLLGYVGLDEEFDCTWRKSLKRLRKLTEGRQDAHDWGRLLSECQSLDEKEAHLSAISLERLRDLHTRARCAARRARSLNRVLEKEGAPRWVLKDIPLAKTKGRS